MLGYYFDYQAIYRQIYTIIFKIEYFCGLNVGFFK